MNAKRFLPLLLLAALIPLGYYASWCGVYPECPLSSTLHGLSFTLFKPLWVFSLYAIAGTLFLPFVREQAFKLWSRFAVLWVVLSVLAVLWAPETMNTWLPLVSYTKADVARWMGSLFSIISIVLIIIGSLVPTKRALGRR